MKPIFRKVSQAAVKSVETLTNNDNNNNGNNDSNACKKHENKDRLQQGCQYLLNDFSTKGEDDSGLKKFKGTISLFNYRNYCSMCIIFKYL